MRNEIEKPNKPIEDLINMLKKPEVNLDGVEFTVTVMRIGNKDYKVIRKEKASGEVVIYPHPDNRSEDL